MPSRLDQYYRALRKAFGPQHWWPGETPFEVMVGAILTQNTAWANVEKAIANLKGAGMLDPHRLDRADLPTIARLIRPAGYFNVKAKRLRAYVRWFVERFDGDVRKMSGVTRDELLEVHGVGRETADSILLYALGRPEFVVDAYTWRILHRHGFVPEETDYDEMKSLFEGALPRDAKLFNEFHALIVRTGKDYCKPTPKCEACPLKRYLS